MNEVVRASFLAKVGAPDERGCLPWLACKDTGGYGQIAVFRIRVPAHRLSWMLEYGEIPKGMFVCHHCDNPGCVNPSHLFLGDQTANMRDRKEKGRYGSAAGERNPNAKLTALDVEQIRASCVDVATRKAAAARFGVSETLIRSIVKRLVWRT